MDTTTIKWIIGVFVTVVVGLNALWLRYMDRKYDGPKLRKMNAEADSQEIQNMQAIVEEVRQQRTTEKLEHAQQMGELNARLNEAFTRIGKMEERERHQLVRSAVHESWDRIAYRLLLQHDPNFEPPPPLHSPHELEQAEREHVDRLQSAQDEG